MPDLEDLETTYVAEPLVGVGVAVLLGVFDLNAPNAHRQRSGPKISDIGLFTGDHAEATEVMDRQVRNVRLGLSTDITVHIRFATPVGQVIHMGTFGMRMKDRHAVVKDAGPIVGELDGFETNSLGVSAYIGMIARVLCTINDAQ